MTTRQEHEEKFEALQRTFNEMDLLPVVEPPEPNLFSLAGPGHNENRLTDLMALFMGSHSTAPRWLAKALVTAVHRKAGFQPALDCEQLADMDWSTVAAERERSVWDDDFSSAKRLDLVISNDAFVLGVEHKVWASASYNPFSLYEQLVRSYERSHMAICVLRPDDYADDVPPEWLVVSYRELLLVAYEQYGSHVVKSPHDKWHIFYLELLKHLDSIASPQETKTMDPKELEFSLKHFHHLREAESYLNRLKEELVQRGKSHISRRLEVSESEITWKADNWGQDLVAIRFFPGHWGGENQVCLIYSSDQKKPGADETITFYVKGFADVGHVPVSLDSIHQAYLKDMPKRESPDRENSDLVFYMTDAWYESNNQYLALRGGSYDDSMAGAMAALGDLASWLNSQLGYGE